MTTRPKALPRCAKNDLMEHGRLVKVTPPSSKGDAIPIVYVVAAEDPDEAMRLVADKVIISSDIQVIGRCSRQLLEVLNLKPGELLPA
jgi:hypothetical protein